MNERGARVSKRWTAVLGGVLALVLVVVVAIVAIDLYRSATRSQLRRALDQAPGDTQRYSWTDWAGVRRALKADDLTSDSSTEDLDAFLSRGFDADLTSTSAMVESADVLRERYGFSPANIDWEMFSQSATGALLTLHLPDSVDFADLENNLGALGYTAPGKADAVWQGGEDLIARIGQGATPELQYVALDAGDHLVRASDDGDFLARVLGSGGSGAPGDFGGGPGADLDAVADASKNALSASLYTGDYACGALAMSQANESDQAQAAQLVEQAGKVNPLSAFAISVQPDRRLIVALGFENHDQAVTNADSRAALASGPALGQGGDFADRFSLSEVRADGDLVVLDLDPAKDSFVISDLSTGPVLFATC